MTTIPRWVLPSTIFLTVANFVLWWNLVLYEPVPKWTDPYNQYGNQVDVRKLTGMKNNNIRINGRLSENFHQEV